MTKTHNLNAKFPPFHCLGSLTSIIILPLVRLSIRVSSLIYSYFNLLSNQPPLPLAIQKENLNFVKTIDNQSLPFFFLCVCVWKPPPNYKHLIFLFILFFKTFLTLPLIPENAFQLLLIYLSHFFFLFFSRLALSLKDVHGQMQL